MRRYFFLIRNAIGEIHRVLRRFFHAAILVPQWRKEMIRQTRQMTPKRTDAGLLTSDSEPFAFFGVIWRILFGCGGAALGNPRLKRDGGPQGRN